MNGKNNNKSEISRNQHAITDKIAMEEIYDFYISGDHWLFFIPLHQLTQSNLELFDEIEQKYFTPNTELNKYLRTITFNTYDILYIFQKDKVPIEHMKKILPDEMINRDKAIIIWPYDIKLFTTSHNLLKRINDSIKAIHNAKLNGINHWKVD